MAIQPTAFNPAARGAAALASTHDAQAGAPKFIQPARDRAPAQVSGGEMPRMDPNAPEDQKLFFERAENFFSGTMPHMGIRLGNMLREYGGNAPQRAEFMFKGKPASVQTQEGRVVINFGSDDDNSAGQVSVINRGYVQAKGVAVNNPKLQELAVQHAGTALCLGLAQQQNMPHAAAAVQAMQNLKASLD